MIATMPLFRWTQRPVVRRVLTSRTAVISMAVIAAFALIAALASFLAPQDPYLMNVSQRLEGPS